MTVEGFLAADMAPRKDEGNSFDSVYSMRHAEKDTRSSLGYTLGQAKTGTVVRQTRTQDAGDEKCYADFACSSASSKTHRELAPRAGGEADAAFAEIPAAGAASSVLKGTGTWVFEKDWAIAPSPSARKNGGSAAGAHTNPPSTKMPSETHERYGWPDMESARLSRARPAKQQQQLGKNPLGLEKVTYRSVTHNDFRRKEYSVREPIKPPLTSISSGEKACNGRTGDQDVGVAGHQKSARGRYETTQNSHFPEKSRLESNKMSFAGNANTVICTYNIINGRDGAVSKKAAVPLAYEGYFHGTDYSKKRTPHPTD